MSKIAITSIAIAVVVTAGALLARASHPRRLGWQHRGPLCFLAGQLDLSHSQKAQIKSIWRAESPTVASLLREFAAEQKQMNSVTAQGNFDREKVQAIADLQASTVAKLLVEKQRLQSKIYADVLTREQKTKADHFVEQWPTRLDGIADRLAKDDSGNPAYQ